MFNPVCHYILFQIHPVWTENTMTASYVTDFELASALRWQMEMGVDTALLDTPLAQMPQPAPVFADAQTLQDGSAGHPSYDRSSTPPPVSATHTTDLSAVRTLTELKQALAAFEGCALKKTASNLVFADGNPDAPVMIIGEAPGGDEDRMGLPFVGAAGQLLDKMLASVGLDRQHVYITNILPWRPPGNRTPSSEEVAMLWPFLKRHIQLKAPQVILALGGSSAKLILNTSTGILKLRGQVQEIDFGEDGSPVPIPVLPSLHPAYLLRAPIMKRQAFADLLTLRTLNRG